MVKANSIRGLLYEFITTVNNFFLRSKDKKDIDVIRENHKFLWEDHEEPDSWEKKLAKKYYDKLFKEYCICDLSRFKEKKVNITFYSSVTICLVLRSILL